MNHAKVKHSFSSSLTVLASLGGLALITGLAGGCIAPAAEVDRQADPSHSEETASAASEAKPLEEREHVVDDRAANDEERSGELSHDRVAPARVDESNVLAEGTASEEDPGGLVAAASSPTDTPQPSPWKGHNPPPTGPAAGPPSSDTASSP